MWITRDGQLSGYRVTCSLIAYLWMMTPCHFVDGEPSFLSVVPSKGPLEGATILTIEMIDLGDDYPVSIFIGNLSASIENNNGRTLVATTPPAGGELDGEPQPVAVLFNSSLSYFTNFTFTYFALPNVTSIYPQQYIYTGGIRLTVYGEGLDIAASPVLEVTTTARLLVRSRWQLRSATYQSVCDDANTTRLVCVLPALLLPAQIRSYLDSLLPTYNESHMHKDFIPDAVTSLVNRGYVDDGDGNTMFVYIGLLFDGNVKYRNLSSQLGRNGSTVLVPGPTILTEPPWVIDLAVAHEDIGFSEFWGQMLSLGTSADDYIVLLDKRPLVVESVNGEIPGAVRYRLPTSFNVTTNATAYEGFKCPQNYSHVQIYVGYRLYNQSCLLVKAACISEPCRNGGICTNIVDSYVCTCTGKFYGRNCTYDYPVITSIFPDYGPQAGGTILLVTATIPRDRFEPLGIYFGSTYIPVEDSSADYFILESSATNYSGALPVSILFNWTDIRNDTGNVTTQLKQLNITAKDEFTYRPNPVIIDIYPRDHVLTGGTTLTVNGTDLTSVAVPYLKVTASFTWQINAGTPTTAQSSFTSRCTTSESTTMTCRFPVVDIPHDFLPHLDSLNYTPLWPSGGQINSTNPSSTSPCPKYQQSSSGKTSSQISFHVGFVLDGVTDFTDLGEINVFPPPNICFNETMITYRGSKMTVTGTHLLRGVTMQDYTIQIENLTCMVVSISDSEVSFLPINRKETPDFDYFKDSICPESYPFLLAVTVAGNDVTYAGCVDYNATRKYDACENAPCGNGTCVLDELLADGYWCRCDSGHHGDACQWGIPVFEAMTPDYGPIAGGTPLTIKVYYSSEYSPVAVFFNGSVQETVNSLTSVWNSTESVYEITLKTPLAVRLVDPSEDVEVPVSVHFNISDEGAFWWPINANFTYRLNPTFSDVSPREHAMTGGTAIRIAGSGLDISQSPNMTIVIEIKTKSVIQAASYDYTYTLFPTPNCTVDSSELLICHMPPTEIPDDDFKDNLIDSATLQPPVNDRRKRSAADDRDVISNYPSSKRRFRTRRDVSVVTPSGKTMTVYVQLQFDNLQVNLTPPVLDQSELLLRRPPSVELPSSLMNYYPGHDQIIEVQGARMDVGSDWLVDLTVLVGGFRVNVTYAQEDGIWIDLPENPDELRSIAVSQLDADDYNCLSEGELDSSTNLSTIYLVEVRIGYYYGQGGCVHYAYSVETEDFRHLVGVYLGASVGGSVLIIITIAVITRQRKPDDI